MFWFDWMTLGIVLAVAINQTVRGVKAGGMGLPLFEACGLVVAAVASTNLSGGISQAVHMQKSVIMIVLFLLLSIGAFVGARWLFTVTEWSFESLDGFLSFVFGLVAGWTIAHMVLRIIIEFQGSASPVAAMMPDAQVAREVFQFRGWNWLMRLLFRARLMPEFNPDEG
jgi:hypothetical protein